MIRQGLIVFLLSVLFVIPQPGMAFSSRPEVTAKSAIIIEASTGKIIYAKNAGERRYPASTTKMLTLITALEHGNVNDMVMTSTEAASTEGSSLWLTPGETLSMLDMLYGIMLVSGNDATVAVAQHISGSVEAFAKLMTQKAHAIGATSSNFTNPNGLPDDNHYSTAQDLARIAAYGYKNELFTKIVSTQRKVIPWPGKDHARDLYNENRMLWLYDGGNGVKTGYTDAAGRCLVSAANRNGVQLIAVVLDSERMWDDSIALLDYGFKQVKPRVLFNQGETLKTVRVMFGQSDAIRLVNKEEVVVPIFENEEDEVHTVFNVPTSIEAPIATGQKIGEVKIMYKNNEIASADLVADQSVEKKSLFSKLWGSLWSFFTFVVRNFA